MAIRDYRGSNLGESFNSISALKEDMGKNGYRILECGNQGVVLDDGSFVSLSGDVRKSSRFFDTVRSME